MARRRLLAGVSGWLLCLICFFVPPNVSADEELDFGLETHRLAQITIQGNSTFSEDRLKGLLSIQEPSLRHFLNVPQYRPHLIETQLNVVKGFYRNRGFHQVGVTLDSVTTLADKGDVLHISVDEGPRTYIRTLSFLGTGPLSEEALRDVIQLSEGKPAPATLNAFGGDIYAVRDLYRNATYLEASVVPQMSITELDTVSGYMADVVYRINPGPPFAVRDIVLKGNLKTQPNLLTRELTINAGDPLVWQQVEDSRRRLLGTSLFRDVTIMPTAVDTTVGKADLTVQVVERRPAYYELGVGVGSEERVRLLAAWAHHNLWGTGRRLEVRTRMSWNVEDVLGNPITFNQGQINYRAEVVYVNPHLRGSRYSFNTNVFTKRETRGESALNMAIHGFNVGTTWKPSRRVTNSVHLGLKVTDPELHPLAPEDSRERFTDAGVKLSQTRSINWSLAVDHRDDVFHPTEGMYSIGRVKLAGSLLGGDYTFFKWSAAWHHYNQTILGGTLAARFMVGGARPFGKSLDLGDEGVPYDDRFFAGGASSVRGYGHNSLGPQITDPDELEYLNYTSDVLLPDNPARGGNYLMLTNLEWRFPLPVLKKWKFAGVFFFEGGNVWAHSRDIRILGFRLQSAPGTPTDHGSTKTWDYRYSYGTGIRLDTPFGPVRVDVGFPLKRARYLSETVDRSDPKVVWHFSLGYPF